MIGSLCTGYGGLDQAVAAITGADTAWVSDLDPGASALLAHRYPGVPNIGDLTAVDWSTVAPVDYLVAGYPCQPYSAAGKRLGNDDPRAIFPSVIRAIRALEPRLVFLENVRGHLGRGFDSVLGALADAGYDAGWRCLRASDVGAAHRRERLFIVAWPAADAENLRHERGRATRHWGHRSADSRDTSADPSGDRRGRLAAAHDHDGRDAQRDDAHGRCDAAADADGAGLEGRHPHAERRGELTSWPGGLAPWGQYAGAIRRWERRLGRPAPSPTEPGRNGKPRLAPAFSEWLMGLPAGWVTDVPGLTRNQQLKLLGNGVLPQQAEAAYRLLLADLGLTTIHSERAAA